MEYRSLTILAEENETQATFANRLATFWTHMLRTHPTNYERVYSEAVAFEVHSGRTARQYMVEPGVVEPLTDELRAKGFAVVPVDDGEEYTKAEASAGDFFQLEH